MKCVLCRHGMYDKFHDNYIISYCSECKLEHCKKNMFIDIVVSKILENKYKLNISTYMISFFKKIFSNDKFSLITKSNLCKLSDTCDGAVTKSNCYIYQYNYYGFKFYYCFYNNLIVYNPDDLAILIKFLLKKAKINLYIQFIKNIGNKIKLIFIK